jgi:hypothetical protein
LQNYHTDVTPSLFNCPTNVIPAFLWICFISEEIKPSVLLIKNALDFLFAESNTFLVQRVDDNLFSSKVASDSVRSEILQRAPINLNGAKLLCFPNRHEAQLAVKSNSNSNKHSMPSPVQTRPADGILGPKSSTTAPTHPPIAYHDKYHLLDSGGAASDGKKNIGNELASTLTVLSNQQITEKNSTSLSSASPLTFPKRHQNEPPSL